MVLARAVQTLPGGVMLGNIESISAKYRSTLSSARCILVLQPKSIIMHLQNGMNIQGREIQQSYIPQQHSRFSPPFFYTFFFLFSLPLSSSHGHPIRK